MISLTKEIPARNAPKTAKNVMGSSYVQCSVSNFT